MTITKSNHSIDTITDLFFDSPQTNFSTFLNPVYFQVQEDENGYCLQLPVPGKSRKDLAVTLRDNVLEVVAQKNDKKKAEWCSMLRHSFTIPPDSDVQSIEAKCRDGLLTIHIKKIKSIQSKKRIFIGGENASENLRYWWSKTWKGISDLANKLKRSL